MTQKKIGFTNQASEESKLPSIETLYKDKALTVKKNELAVLLNCDPKKEWLAERDLGNGKKLKYLPIERVEWLMVSVFKTWKVEIKNIQLIGNSVVVTVKVWYQELLSGEWEFTDGIGAQPLQTRKGSGAIDWDNLNTLSVQMAAPAAESYAIKDACEKLGKLFGKDINRGREIGYDHLLKQEERLKSLDDKFKKEKT